MGEIDIVKENQKKSGALKMRSSTTFAELMAYSTREAAQYAIDCWINTNIMGMSAEDYIKSLDTEKKETKEENKPENKEEIVEETPIKVEEGENQISLGKEDYKELLKANGIKFNHNLGEQKLKELVIENNLL